MANPTNIQQALRLPYDYSDRLAEYHQNIFSDSATSTASKWNLTWTWIPNTALNLTNSLLAPVIALVRLAAAAVFCLIGQADTAKQHLASSIRTVTNDLGTSIVRLFYFSFQNSRNCFNAIQGSESEDEASSGDEMSTASLGSKAKPDASSTIPGTSDSSAPVGTLARLPHKRVHPITSTEAAVNGVVAKLTPQSREYSTFFTSHGWDGWNERNKLLQQLRWTAEALLLCTEPVHLIDDIIKSCRKHALQLSYQGFSDLTSAILGAPIYRYQDNEFIKITREFSEVEEQVMQEVKASHDWERFLDFSSEELYRERSNTLIRTFQNPDDLVTFLTKLVPQKPVEATSHSLSTKAATYQLSEEEVMEEAYERLIPYMLKRLDWEAKQNPSRGSDARENAQSSAQWIAGRSLSRSSQPQILVHVVMDLIEKQEREQPELQPLMDYSFGGGSLQGLFSLILDPKIPLDENFSGNIGRVMQLAKKIRALQLPLGNTLQEGNPLISQRIAILKRLTLQH